MRNERQELARRALQLRSQGLTLKQIGARLGRSEGEVSRLVRAVASPAEHTTARPTNGATYRKTLHVAEQPAQDRHGRCL
jgi:transcriptional regulator with XRE-family HTH domain